MTMTFFRTSAPRTGNVGQGIQNHTQKINPNNLIQVIESACNFSTTYSLQHSPEADILQGKITSVVFKTKESPLQQLVTYHLWKKGIHGPEQYTITVCTKDKELVTLVHKCEDLPHRYFKITPDNEVDIIILETCRP